MLECSANTSLHRVQLSLQDGGARVLLAAQEPRPPLGGGAEALPAVGLGPRDALQPGADAGIPLAGNWAR